MKKHWWIVLVLILALTVPAVASQAIKILMDGKEMKTDVPAQIINSRTMVPLRAISEYLGKTVNWDNATKTVTITGKSDFEKINQIYGDVGASAHKVLASPDRVGVCTNCHSGTGYSNRDNADFEYVVGTMKVGLSCETCHTGVGAGHLESGEVELPFMAEPYQAGAGALCMSCHNGRTDTADAFSKVNAEGFRTAMGYPHYGGAQLFTGKGGMEVPGVTYATSFGHPNLEDGCVSCHMPKTGGDDFRSHDFLINKDTIVGEVCGSCHGASFDFQGFQAEVYAMNNKLKQAAIDAVPGAVDVGTGHGSLIFKDAAGNEIPADQVPQKAYVAAFNWYTIYGDGSKGVHNPRYTKSLLQETYKYTTGQEMQ